MEHRGEIIEQAVRNSGLAISKIAERLGKSRRWMYLMFENPNVPFETIEAIGKILHHDFSDEIKSMNSTVAEPPITYAKQDANYWREKYYTLLEEYNELLKKK
jgi:hypothetical protein